MPWYRRRRKPAESDISFCLVGVHAGPVGAALAEAELSELFETFVTLSDTLGGAGG